MVFPFTMSPILHICSYPGFFDITLFILIKVIHIEECTTTPVHETNDRYTEVIAKRERERERERDADTAVHCLKITDRDFPEVFASGLSAELPHVSSYVEKKMVYVYEYATKY